MRVSECGDGVAGAIGWVGGGSRGGNRCDSARQKIYRAHIGPHLPLSTVLDLSFADV